MSANQARKDIGPLWRGELQGIERTDAILNIVSMMGWPGATISLGYFIAKEGAKGMQNLNRRLQLYFTPNFIP